MFEAHAWSGHIKSIHAIVESTRTNLRSLEHTETDGGNGQDGNRNGHGKTWHSEAEWPDEFQRDMS